MTSAGLTPLVAALAIGLAAPAHAHPWQAGSPPLSEAQVAEVLTASRTLAESAAAQGWRPEGDAANLTLGEAVIAYAHETSQFTLLPEIADRVFLSLAALKQGLVNADGTYRDDDDLLFWFEVLHTGDLPAVAARIDAFDALRPLFSVPDP
ncbi:hypothetical protein [Oceanibium sediminis]|uniref:hypothetical protein n=1 Tax=Oceanibium sediminis TaxID=2026339 RepID=UPI000DD46157|nr:hypothetical protein [Oceanibium sediminis]